MATWADLEAELASWADAGREATLWWRDDDAAEPCPALDRLLALSDRFAVPLALATVPMLAAPELGAWLLPHGLVAPVQHGVRHGNHAPPGEKAAELGAHRPVAVMLEELAEGLALIRSLPRARAVLVPPWNRIDAALADRLGSLGYAGLSTYGPRERAEAAPGVRLVNTHIDVIAWRAGRTYAGDDKVLEEAVQHLRARRLGKADPDEPTGLLTHHLVHDDLSWAFLERFFRLTSERPAVRWLDAETLFETRNLHGTDP